MSCVPSESVGETIFYNFPFLLFQFDERPARAPENDAVIFRYRQMGWSGRLEQRHGEDLRLKTALAITISYDVWFYAFLKARRFSSYSG